MIISASRRTDIPAFYSDWFFNRLKAGSVRSVNPFNHRQFRDIPLSPDAVDCFVFWTKDPENMIDRLHLLDEQGYHYYFLFTLNAYGKDIEPGLRDLNKRIDTFHRLSEMIGRRRLVWRYDPVILTEKYNIGWHRQMFSELCIKLGAYASHCIISFVDDYPSKGIRMAGGDIYAAAQALSDVGRENGVSLKACAETLDFSLLEIEKSSCIDAELISELCDGKVKFRKDINQRKECGCAESIDIGAYGTCAHGCIYCYASRNRKKAVKYLDTHDPDGAFLGAHRHDD